MLKTEAYSVKNTLLVSVYLLFLLGVGWYQCKKPGYNCDALLYAAVVLQYNHTPGHIHQQVYQTAAQQMPPATYWQLAQENPKRISLATDAKVFNDQLPFYVVKPLYTFIAYLFYKCGVPLFTATVVPSALALVFSGILLLVWLGKYLPVTQVIACCVVVMLLPNVQEASRLSSPDFLAGFFVLLGIYFLLEKASAYALFICFLLALMSRIDMIIPLLVLYTTLLVAYRGKAIINIKQYMGMVAIAIVAYLLVANSAKSYHWSALYFPSFIPTLTAGYSSSFNLHGYIELVKAQLFTGLYYSHCCWVLLLGVLVFIKNKREGFKLENVVLLALLISVMIRFVMQPVIVDRFYIGYCLVIIALLIKQFAPVTKAFND